MIMELFPPLTAFYAAIADDIRIGSTHISIYMALLQQWNLNGGENPILIERGNLMTLAKINSRQTYNQCMNDLQEFGLIKYFPASNGTMASKVNLICCDKEK
jgi:replication initiation and membrane attachment protein DnaB